jgi:serine protease
VFVPNDLLRTNQWFHYEAYGVRAYTAWDVERGAAGVVMALLDTGILPHADLDGARVLPGYDFVSDTALSNDGNGLDANPTDPGDAVAAGECGVGTPAQNSSWHGLHLAGIMIAESDNNIGVAGLNHASRLLPVRVLGKCGGSYADIIAGILWAAGLPGSGAPGINPTPARVINLSFAAEQTCTAGIQDAINRAVAAGVVVVAAAGNGNGNTVANVLPAGCDNVIAVAATTRAGDIASFSNVGSRVALSAPGGDAVVAANGIFSLYNAGLTAAGADDYAYVAGTSVAAAQVTAGVSLLLSAQPALSGGDVRTILRQTAQAFPAGGCPAANCGAGILDLAAAVQLAQTFTPSGSGGASAASGGGGGGGCTLGVRTSGAGGAYDLAWLLVLAGLAFVRRAVYASRT